MKKILEFLKKNIWRIVACGTIVIPILVNVVSDQIDNYFENNKPIIAPEQNFEFAAPGDKDGNIMLSTTAAPPPSPTTIPPKNDKEKRNSDNFENLSQSSEAIKLGYFNCIKTYIYKIDNEDNLLPLIEVNKFKQIFCYFQIYNSNKEHLLINEIELEVLDYMGYDTLAKEGYSGKGGNMQVYYGVAKVSPELGRYPARLLNESEFEKSPFTESNPIDNPEEFNTIDYFDMKNDEHGIFIIDFTATERGVYTVNLIMKYSIGDIMGEYKSKEIKFIAAPTEDL